MKKTILLCVGIYFLFSAALGQIQIGIRVPQDYVKVNDAVQAAPSGATVYISPGVYDLTTQDFPIVLKDGVSIEGSGYAQTFLDSGGTGAPIMLAQNITTTGTIVTDLTIQNCDVSATGGGAVFVLDCTAVYFYDVRFLNNKGTTGAGMYVTNSALYVQECRFEGNEGTRGGGVYVESAASAPLFVRNTFINNYASQSGGGFYISQASGTGIYYNTFTKNRADVSGGGIAISNGSPEFFENVLEQNQAPNGGGLALNIASPPIQGNRFVKNQADEGGGIFSTGGATEIYGNSFSYNRASVLGAAYSTQSSTDKFLNNMVHHNFNQTGTGAATAVTNSNVDFIQNTIAYNQSDAGLGLFNSPIPVFNNIFAFNQGVGLFEYDAASDPDSQYNLFYQNTITNYMDEGTNPLNTAAQINSANNAPQLSQMNIVNDPEFKDPLMGDFHIRATSPARESATLTPPTFPEQDMDLEIRKWAYSDTLPDIGADEASFPRIIGPIIYYDLNDDDIVTSGDQVIVTFNRDLDSVTTPTAADFYLPVTGDSLGSGAVVRISDENPCQLVIWLGDHPYLTIKGQYDDANQTPGSPSGIDVAVGAPSGLHDEDGFPASPLGFPGPNTTGLDIDHAYGDDTQYAGWYSNSTLTVGGFGYYPEARLRIPILSSYYQGFITMRRPIQYFDTTSAVAFDGTYSLFIFDPFNPPTLTLSYSENEIDFTKGEREENMRIFRLNRQNPDHIFFELVPGALGRPQVVDTVNNTVSVNLTYLYPPRNPPYTPGMTFPYDHYLYDESDGIYAVFPVMPFTEVRKTVQPGAYSDTVSLQADAADPYFSHQVLVHGFREDAGGSVNLFLRPARDTERELFYGNSNAVFVVEAKQLDNITPVDISSTASVILDFKDHFHEIFPEDVADSGGIKSSKPQLVLSSVNPDTGELDTASGSGLFLNPVSNLLMDDVSPLNFHSGRSVIGATVSDSVPFSYRFHYNEENWKFYSVFEGFDPCVSGNGYGYLSIAGSTSNSYSFWESPVDEAPIVEGYLYRARIPMDTDIYSQNICPSFRLRINSENLQLNPMLRVISNREGYASPSLGDPKTYEHYFVPPNSAIDSPPEEDDLRISFDYINRDLNDYENTALFFRGVEIDRIPLDSLTSKTTIVSYEFEGDNEGWTSGNAEPDFSTPVFSETGHSLYMGVTGTNVYGFWEKDTGVPITTGTLYCARFHIHTDVPNRDETPDFRLRVTTRSFMQASILREQNYGDADSAPILIPREYVVYFYPDQELLTRQLRETIVLSVDLINLSSKSRFGTGIYVDRVVLECYAPPPWPY